MEHTAEALSAIRRAQTERAPLLGIPVQGRSPFIVPRQMLANCVRDLTVTEAGIIEDGTHYLVVSGTRDHGKGRYKLRLDNVNDPYNFGVLSVTRDAIHKWAAQQRNKGLLRYGERKRLGKFAVKVRDTRAEIAKLEARFSGKCHRYDDRLIKPTPPIHREHPIEFSDGEREAIREWYAQRPLRKAISRIRAIDKAQDVIKARKRMLARRKREQEPLSLATFKRRNCGAPAVNLSTLYKLLAQAGFAVKKYSDVKRTRHGSPDPSFASYFHHLYHYCCGLRLKPDALKLSSYRYQRLFEGSAEQMQELQERRCEYIKQLRDYEYFQGQLQQLRELLADYQRQAEAEAQAAGMTFLDRSRLESWQQCPRRFYWGYVHGGRGLQPIRHSVPLLTGTLTHQPIVDIVLGSSVDAAIAKMRAAYSEAVKSDGLALEAGEDAVGVAEEQSALAEALTRAYAALRLPALLEAFTILSAETEYQLELASDVTLLVRPDLVLRRKSDGLAFLLDYKTVAQADRWWADALRYDTVTLAQILPVEATLGEKLGGVIIEGLVKGKRSEYKGRWQQSSPLIYAWHKPDSEKWQARYEWSCTDAHLKDDGKVCGGGITHKLSGYYKAAVWREYPGGVAAWVERLLREDAPLVAEQFIQLPPILRSDSDVAEWRETAIATAREWVAEPLAAALPILYPKHTGRGNCVRPSKCSFFDCCWGIAGADPIGSGLFKEREANHPAEFAEEVV